MMRSHPLPFVETGVLYREDNLTQLAQFEDECIDLIYLDPPFFSNRVYEVIWGDEAEVRSFEDRWSGGIQNYVEWMHERVIQMHRALRENGSLYLHCDPHASHYLKVMLDDVFGFATFRAEIVWKRTNARSTSGNWPRIHDVILYYSKGDRPQFASTVIEADSSKMPHTLITGADGKKYQTYELTAPGRTQKGESGKPWRGYDPDSFGRHWANSRDVMDAWDADGLIHWPARKGFPRRRAQQPFDDRREVVVGDVWTDIDRLNQTAKERLGYPTQKPEALLERIVCASSKPGDIVLDPFCGCGTTVAVADRLKRQWIGIDISPTAMEIMRRRLLKQGCAPVIENAPDSIPALKELKPFEFQNWVINAVNGTHSPRKVGDMGIDGYWFFTKEPVQVKQSEHVGRNVIDNFETALRRAGQNAGYIIAFSFTRGAVEETARARHDGLEIRLVKVSEILLLVKGALDFSKKIGPQPATIEELPLPPVRKASDKPTAEELIESDRRRVS